MPKLRSEHLPKYRRQRASGQAIVTLNGRDHYLGSYDTLASKREYDRLTSEWLAAGRQLPSDVAADLTIVEVLAAFRRFAIGHGHPLISVAISWPAITGELTAARSATVSR